jgi:hypothetical protein
LAGLEGGDANNPQNAELAGRPYASDPIVFEEDALEVDCSVLTPHDVLKTSGQKVEEKEEDPKRKKKNFSFSVYTFSFPFPNWSFQVDCAVRRLGELRDHLDPPQR